MVVRDNIAKFNENNCKSIISSMDLGMSVIDAVNLEFKANRHNPKKIKGIEYENNKYFWIFKMLEVELNKNQSLQSC